MNKSKSIIRLRKRGWTNGEIAAKLGCCKNTVLYWVRRTKMSIGEAERLEAIRLRKAISSGKIGRNKNLQQMAQQRNLVIREAKQEYKVLSKDSFFIFGLSLYIGEGAKGRDTRMANLDLDILKIFVRWSKRFLGAKRFTGYMFTEQPQNYGEFCKLIDKKLGIELRWADHPLPRKAKKNEKFDRPFGTVYVRAVGGKLASYRLKTWIDLAMRQMAK